MLGQGAGLRLKVQAEQAVRAGTFCVGIAAGLNCAAAAPDFSKLAATPPCPALVSAAQADGIPLEGVDAPGEAGRFEAGDSLSALVTLFEPGARQTQWLLYLKAVVPPDHEAGSKPGPMVMYSCQGNKLEYASSPVPVSLRTLGPFAAVGGKPARVQEKIARFSLDKGFLSIGLDQAAAAIVRMERTQCKGNLWFSPHPPNAAQLAEGVRLAKGLQLTAEEERALGGMFPTLFSYFAIVQHTEGLEDILFKVVEKPSVWSVVRHVGVTADLTVDSEHFSLAEHNACAAGARSAAYYFPMQLTLNKKPALTVTFLVTDPRPPLLACGGIVGLLAEKPGGKETYLTLRILSARHEAAAAVKAF